MTSAASEPERVRVGGIDYLNALPLTRYLSEEGDPPLDISSHVPGVLADKLRAGELDIALVPVVEYLAREEYRILPGISIASYGEVRSIRFYHRKPLADLRFVGLDACSRTSALLTRLLFRDCWRISPELVQITPAEAARALGDDGMPREHERVDGFLLIGDAALSTPAPDGWEVFDLGTAWTRWTGLPFVYAFWVWRGGPAPPGLAERFERAKQTGLARIDEVVKCISLPSGLDVAAARHYLYRVIQYDFDAHHVEGLLEFFRRLQSSLKVRWNGGQGASGKAGPLRWLEESPSLPA